ncbi:MAG: large subunit ribosomal protein [Actinomycetota bacterium]
MGFGTKTNEREGTRAVLRNCPGSASKVRVVLDLIRGLDVQSARDVLEFCERDAATIVGKLLDSAVANAEHNDEMNGEELFVSACFADEARTQKRFKPRARGRAGKIFKRTSHITIIVSRLPEDRLARMRSKAEAAQAERRSRRTGANQERGRRARVAASQAAQSGHEGHAHEGEAMQDAVVVNETPVVVNDALETEEALTEAAEANLDEQSAFAVEATEEANADAPEVEASAPEQEAAPDAENTETDVMPEASAEGEETE